MCHAEVVVKWALLVLAVDGGGEFGQGVRVLLEVGSRGEEAEIVSLSFLEWEGVGWVSRIISWFFSLSLCGVSTWWQDFFCAVFWLEHVEILKAITSLNVVEVSKVADKNISQKASLPCQQELTIWFGGEKKLAKSRITKFKNTYPNLKLEQRNSQFISQHGHSCSRISEISKSLNLNITMGISLSCWDSRFRGKHFTHGIPNRIFEFKSLSNLVLYIYIYITLKCVGKIL